MKKKIIIIGSILFAILFASMSCTSVVAESSSVELVKGHLDDPNIQPNCLGLFFLFIFWLIGKINPWLIDCWP